MSKGYWEGFKDGQNSSLNHNLLLLKEQLKAIEKTPLCRKCKKECVNIFYKKATICDTCRSKLAKKANKKRHGSDIEVINKDG